MNKSLDFVFHGSSGANFSNVDDVLLVDLTKSKLSSLIEISGAIILIFAYLCIKKDKTNFFFVAPISSCCIRAISFANYLFGLAVLGDGSQVEDILEVTTVELKNFANSGCKRECELNAQLTVLIKICNVLMVNMKMKNKRINCSNYQRKISKTDFFAI